MENTNSKSYLIDTHILFWIIVDPGRLGKSCSEKLAAADNVYLSNISLFEAAMKAKAKKLPFTINRLLEVVEASGFQLLETNIAHIKYFEKVTLPHKDPFDTLLVAQSLTDSLTLVTADRAILSSSYKNIIDARS